jgi:molybdopterin biosynthesis enzyme
LDVIAIDGIDAVISQLGFVDVKTIHAVPGLPQVVGIERILVIVRPDYQVAIFVITRPVAVFAARDVPLPDERCPGHM